MSNAARLICHGCGETSLPHDTAVDGTQYPSRRPTNCPIVVPPGPNAENGRVSGTLNESEFLQVGFEALVPSSAGLLGSVKPLLEEPHSVVVAVAGRGLCVHLPVDVSK